MINIDLCSNLRFILDMFYRQLILHTSVHLKEQNGVEANCRLQRNTSVLLYKY